MRTFSDLSGVERSIGLVLERSAVVAGLQETDAWKTATLKQEAAMTAIQRGSFLTRLLGRRPRRGQSQIIAEYDQQWRDKGWEKYRPADLQGKGGPWVWGKRRFMLSNEAGAALRLIYLEHALAKLSPERVLEIGCGNGINLLLLAVHMPRVAFAGIEITDGGVAAGRAAVAAGTLPAALAAFAPFEVADPEAVARLSIIQGSGGALPFPDASFDIVFTSLALEQMEDLRDQALKELSRVSSRYVVMLEPFAEMNADGSRRKYVETYNYFQGSIADLSRYGLEVVDTIADMPHKVLLGTALVIARKVGSPGTGKA